MKDFLIWVLSHDIISRALVFSAQLKGKSHIQHCIKIIQHLMDNMPNNYFTERISPDSYSLPQEKKLRA